MKRSLHSSSPAFAVFLATVLLAVIASVLSLFPHQTAQVADSQVHVQIEQLLPAGLLD